MPLMQFVGANYSCPSESWQQAMKTAVRDPAELCRLLSLPPALEEPARRAARLFPLFVPRPFLARMRPGDPTDPLLRQVLPLDAESRPVPGFSKDPVGDQPATRTAGLIQKYQGRVLLIASRVCAVHCRYCFRRHFPYQAVPGRPAQWQAALRLVAADPTVDEIVLSGGDPLTLSDQQLEQLCRQISQIPHVRRLRIHSRLPIVIPQRITVHLVRLLRRTGPTPVMVIHANHPAELDAAVAAALGRLIDHGIPVLNQAVLLRGVNDSVAALEGLCRRLVNLRVMPYYLHQLDRVAGAAHFEVPVERGRELIAQLRQLLPGYAVPRYVQEEPGQAQKTLLA